MPKMISERFMQIGIVTKKADSRRLSFSCSPYAGFCRACLTADRDDHLSSLRIAPRIQRRGSRPHGTIRGSDRPIPPCSTRSLPSPLRDSPVQSRGRFTCPCGLVSVALVLTRLYLICGAWVGVTHRAFHCCPDVPPWLRFAASPGRSSKEQDWEYGSLDVAFQAFHHPLVEELRIMK